MPGFNTSDGSTAVADDNQANQSAKKANSVAFGTSAKVPVIEKADSSLETSASQQNASIASNSTQRAAVQNDNARTVVTKPQILDSSIDHPGEL